MNANSSHDARSIDDTGSLNDRVFRGAEALTFDDLLVVPGWSEVLPHDVDTSTDLGSITLQIPLMSAAMDTVTEAPLAVALAREGGIGVLHRNLSIDEQAEHVERVKKAQSGMISAPVRLGPHATLADAEAIMNRHKISGVPICDDDDHLLGILTNRDIRFCGADEYERRVTDYMTHAPLVTAPIGTTLDEAVAILHQHRIEKLPLVDDEGRLSGLITVKDINKRIEKPDATLDADGRLCVGAAVGVTDTAERAEALAAAGVDVLVIDTAHGHTRGVIDAIRVIKKGWPHVVVVGGNVVTAEGVDAMVEAGSDMIKVGVGAGSICTTRIVAGAGMPQMTRDLRMRPGGKATPRRRPGPSDHRRRWRRVIGRHREGLRCRRRCRDARQPAGRGRRSPGRSRTGRRRHVEDVPGYGIGRGHARSGNRSVRNGAGPGQARRRRGRGPGPLCRRARANSCRSWSVGCVPGWDTPGLPT